MNIPRLLPATDHPDRCIIRKQGHLVDRYPVNPPRGVLRGGGRSSHYKILLSGFAIPIYGIWNF